MEDLTKKIQSMQLTKTDRRIADYILEHMDSMGFQTLTSLSIEIGISDTSIIRFIRKLGFRGYAEKWGNGSLWNTAGIRMVCL